MGTLTSITGEMRQGNRGAFAVSLYNFGEVEVLYATEPYTSPVAQIEIPVNDRDKSKMGYWGDSIDKIINADVDKTLRHGAPGVKNQDYLIGKKLHLTLTPGHPIPNRDEATGKWEDRPSECWTLQEMVGMGSIQPTAGAKTPTAGVQAKPAADATAIALDILDNKTIQQWHQEVFSNTAVKTDTKLINLIISGQFISGLEGAGRVSKDANGVYKVV